MLYSQAKVLKTYRWGDEHRFTEHCQLLTEDISQLRRLQQTYPGRVKAIRYEDGALDPHRYTAGIYQFLGLEVTEGVREYVTNITSSSSPRLENTTASGTQRLKRRKRPSAFSVKREKPEMAMQRWRYETGFVPISKISAQCGHLYPLLGYKDVTSQLEMKSNVSLVLTPNKTDLFQ